MADDLSTVSIFNSYQAITAATTAELVGMDFSSVIASLKNKNNNLIKLEMEASKGVVEINHLISTLEKDRAALAQFVDNLILAVTEIKNTPVKNMTEDQVRQREASIQELDKQLPKLKKELKEMDQQLIYLYDVNEDNQKRYHTKVSDSLKTINELNQQMADIIMQHLKTLEINIGDSESFTKEVRKLLNHPEIQASFLSSIGDQDGKGFTQKLKEFFK